MVPWRAPDGLPALRQFADRLVLLRPGDETRIGKVTDPRRARPTRRPALAARPASSRPRSGTSSRATGGPTSPVTPTCTRTSPTTSVRWTSRCYPSGAGVRRSGKGHLDPSRAAVVARLVEAGLAVPIHYGTLWPIGLDAVRPRLFFGPGAEFVHHADRAGVVAVELHPGGEIPEPGADPG